MDAQLSAAALAELQRLSADVGSASERRPEFEVLWERRLVMGSSARCHITARGKSLLQQLGRAEAAAAAR